MDGKRDKPGPKEDRLKLDEKDWEEAMRKALDKERPDDGWPKPAKEERESDESE